jgi:hypothetical protein
MKNPAQGGVFIALVRFPPSDIDDLILSRSRGEARTTTRFLLANIDHLILGRSQGLAMAFYLWTGWVGVLYTDIDY